jgi:hypothetical protein
MTTFKIVFTFYVFLSAETNYEILKPAIIFVSIPYIGPIFISNEKGWRHFTDSKSCQIIESILKYKNASRRLSLHRLIFQ